MSSGGGYPSDAEKAEKPLVQAREPAIAKERPGPSPVLKVTYIALNVFSACAIVFANKMVFATYKFTFVTTLTLVHTLFTWVGMMILARVGFFVKKEFSPIAVAPLAFGYVGYIILNNLSLNLNTVGFYQIMKILIAPCVMLFDYVLFRKVQTAKITMSVAVVCAGISVATITDNVAVKNVSGLVVGLSSVVVTALYQIWAGSKQKELTANSSQLLLAYTPQAILLLSIMCPLLDDIGVGNRTPKTVLGFDYSVGAVVAIVISALLGILVSLSTFLVIGATSSLTYNIVGHAKTVLILAGGCLIFQETMPWKRALGISMTMGGIAWYTYLSMQVASGADKSRDKDEGSSGAAGLLGKGEDAGLKAPLLPKDGSNGGKPPRAPERGEA